MLHDIRYALRTFARRPAFAVAAIATLALGITVNTVAFSLINSLLLRPMPVPAAGRVVRAYPIDRDGRRQNIFSYADYLDYRSATTAFETLAGYIPAELTAGRSPLDSGVVEPRQALGYVASASYFDLTGVRAALGRVLLPDDDTSGARVAVLSDGFWRTRFGGNPAAIGSTLALNGTSFTIVGVAAPGFAGTEPLVADCWIPLPALAVTMTDPQRMFDRDSAALLVAGRLRPGVSRAFAADRLTVEASRLALAYPGRDRAASVAVVAGTFFTIDPGLKPVIGGVLAIVGLVLLIACANAANLALARAASRRREIALRHAIGAGRARIVRQLLIEALLLGLAAGIAALIAAEWLLRAIYRMGLSLAALPWAVVLNLEPDIRVFAYTLGLALTAGAMLGLLPALQSSSASLTGAIQGQGALGGRVRGSSLRQALVVIQVAASLVLLFGAGLLLRALRSAEAFDLGFNTAGVIYADYDPRAARMSAPDAAVFNASLAEAARAMPGVTGVALTSHVPLHGGVRWTAVRLVGAPGTLADPHAIVSTVSPEYFTVMRMPFAAGHGFGAAGADAAPSIVISDALARRFWPAESAIGKVVGLPDSAVPRTVIGVVRDAANASIWREKELAIYLPADATTDARDLRILLRTAGDAGLTSRLLAQRAAALAGNLRFAPMTLDELLRLWNLPSKIAAAGVSGLAALALALACVGLYAVVSFAVVERTRELGIRMALGADAAAVVRLILGAASRLLIVGLVAGAAVALPAARLLGGMLFGVSPYDPLTFVSVVLVLAAVSLAASYAPARRASRLEPLVVLRTE